MDKASASNAVGTWFEYGRGRCNQTLNNWYRLIPIAIRSALKVLKQRSNTRKKKGRSLEVPDTAEGKVMQNL